MKTCTIYGDMTSDSAADNYPRVAVCDECVAMEQALGAECRIVGASQPYDPATGDQCVFCDITADEENWNPDEDD